MAEIAVSLLFDHLVKLLSEKATILGDVHKEVEGIKDQLSLINSYVRDEEKKQQVGSVKHWLNSLRKVAFRMEDVVDHYLLKVAERGQRHGGYRVVTKGMEKLKTVTHRHDIASEIKDVRETLHRLCSLREGLGLQLSATAAPPNHATRRLDAYFVEESQLVGVDHKKKELTDWLTGKQGGKQGPVMVVVGPGGIGKTAIVKNVYNKHEQVGFQKKGTSYFEFCAWITMPRPQVDDHNMLIIRQIIENILEKDPGASATLQRETTTINSLISKVKEYLKDKRYLIVFDDVHDLNFWNVINHALTPNSSKSSKVIITTRDENVAKIIGSGVCKVEPLCQGDALKLFCHKVFQSKKVESPELNGLCQEFMEKCNGVPLAIVAFAGLLARTSKTTTEWRRVLNELDSLLQRNSLFDIVNEVMLESYHELPSHLKRCFLYFGIFPEGYSISCMRLVRLWVTEGFVEKRDNISSEDTSTEELAKEYLAELICRCLVHVSRVDFDGRPKSCHVYDLMHKLIARICEEQMFCQVIKDKTTPSSSNSNLDSSLPRRLSIIKSRDAAAMKRAEKWEKVRTCFVFDDAKKWLVTEELFSSFELLSQLDLSNARLDNLPKQVGNLFNLKYLSLRNTNIKSIPESIGNLERLQTLDLKLTQVDVLPKKIKNLVKLRHLLAYFIYNQNSGLDRLQGVKVNEGLKNLTSLQKLSFLDASDGSVIEDLKQLEKLRKLGIIKLREEYGEELCKVIEKMDHLCSLSIGAMGNDDGNHGMLQLKSIMNPPSSLQRLYLYGRLERLPSWISKVPNLVRLYLRWSNLKEDPLPYLKDLSELSYLEFYDAYGGDELHFKNAWLKGLKVLCLESLPKLKTIKIDEGAIPLLAELKIGKCHEMVKISRDIQNLTSLQKLYLYDMHEQFINGMFVTQSEDYKIINKMPLAEISKDDHFAIFHNTDS